MSFSRGEVWIPGLDPTQGSEQAGTRPVIKFVHWTKDDW